MDLEDAFGERGCPVCTLLKRYDVRSLDSLLYEFVKGLILLGSEDLEKSPENASHHPPKTPL
jgi:hypothetical protein